MKWMINCREATGLSLQAQDRQLGTGERLRLRMHLMVCRACPRLDRKSTRLNSSHSQQSRMPSSA